MFCEEKKMLFSYIDGMKDEMAEISDYIFDNPEIGFEEFKSVEKCYEWLEKEGFKIEKGIAGLDTAFRATYENGTGGASIGLLIEYDALPNPNYPQGAWHACAHHTQPSVMFAVARALKNKLKDDAFKIVIYGTPAEEGGGGKVIMAEKGCFKDIDVALMTHGWDFTAVDEANLAVGIFSVIYHGVTAHAAAGPEQGRSALDAAILTITGMEFLREHTREDVRIHSSIMNGGGPANVVPAKAEAQVVIRSGSATVVDDIVARFKKVVEGACLMTGTTADVINTMSFKNKVPSHILNDMLLNDCRELGFRDVRPPQYSRGSSDFGDVQHMLPGFCLRIPLVPVGIAAHTEGYMSAGKTPETHELLMLTAKAILSVSYDLIKDPELLKRVTAEYKELLAERG